ncbi:hypothetical protein B9Z19DRAFT_1118101 [Tuber borchii]|uniref:Uncharacterized protein n=1 Tax=Tuber borchii TaxID=42251 RepID=A0A2T7A914_TUBBO|nr:hypothetical protein B9Z19DRAFT_1118101 [Tuber borchii]
MEPFNNGILHHPIYPPPKGCPYTSIFHGATESSEVGISGALGMRSRSPFTTSFYTIPSVHRQRDVPIRILEALGMRSRNPLTIAFYAIPSVHCQKDVPIPAFSMALQSILKGDSGSVRYVITEPFYDGVLRHPIYPPPKGRPHTGIFHGATESSEWGIPGALAMRSWNPLMMAFYAIPSIHRQKDVPIQDVSMALQSLLKRGPLYQFFLDIGRALTLKPDSGSVRHAIMEPFNNGVLRYPICHLPKGCPHTRIFHGATESSEGGVLMPSFFDVWKVLTLKPDFGSVRLVIMEPFYNVVLHHPICLPPKGRPHTSILHGATESSEGRVILPGFFSPGYLESAHFKASFWGR